MKNVTDSVVYLGHWSSAGSFGFNTDMAAGSSLHSGLYLMLFSEDFTRSSGSYLTLWLFTHGAEVLKIVVKQKSYKGFLGFVG
uniref:Uncharacterized protein n=1 Tax=Kalanchoe fedtschenkoi TaxID=63787 RepID=A0A7N1A654_KALFE